MLNRVITTITVGSLLYFIISGVAVFNPDNLQPFATLGEEVKEPQTTIPRAIIITLISSIILYSLIALVALGAIGADGMSASNTPLFSSAAVMTTPGVLTIIMVAGTTAMLGVLLSQILATSRMFFAMGDVVIYPNNLVRLQKIVRFPLIACY